MTDSKKKDDALLKDLAHLRRRAFDVKFDLDLNSYQPIENIGIGAYGVVCSAIHKKTNDRVAIKKIPNVFDSKDIAKRTYREIKILKHFKHDNIIHIREILKPKESLNEFRDVYVVFDLMESDLHKIIYSKQELTEEHVRYFLYQILRGLKYIHSAHVIHRDLKPSNLLVNEDCQLRIGDFGMARGFTSSPVSSNPFMTQYVATRWYRAPEIMLSLIEYGAAVDMWSVGCIFAEMLGRKHLFPGKDSISQIKMIVGITGSPDSNLLDLCQSPIIKTFFQEMGHKDPVPWAKMYPKASKKAINFLGRMLVLNPKYRITVEQALVHPYLNKYHDPDDEPICVPTFNFDFENEDLKIPDLRAVIHKEISEYHEPRTPTFSFNACLRPVPKSGILSTPDTVDQSKIKGSELTSTLQTGGASLDKSGHTESSAASKMNILDKPKSIIVSKPTDEIIFKKPLSAKNQEPTVHVKTENLVKVDTTDIEMLSAKSTDGRQPMSATVSEEEVKVCKENKEPGQTKDDKNITVSEDTKNLIKAALLNSSFKKRTDSVGDDDRPKPITAAMRQKEREDKRKKKKEKTLERKKKEKKKIAQPEELLTNEDKELLQRWAKMQKTNVPIAPKPIVEGRGQGQTASNHKSNQSDTGSSSSSSQVKKIPSDSSINSQFQGYYGNERKVQQGTLDLLQQRILGNNSQNTLANQSTNNSQVPVGNQSISDSQNVFVNQSVTNTQNTIGNQSVNRYSDPLGKHTSCAIAGQHVTNNRLSLGSTPVSTINDHSVEVSNVSQQCMYNSNVSSTSGVGTQHSVTSPDQNFSVDFSNVPISDLPNVPLSDIDFLSMMPSPEIANILAQNIPDDIQQPTNVSMPQNFDSVHNNSMYTRTDYNQATFSSHSATNDFIESLCTEAAPVETRRTSGHFVPLDLQQNKSPNLLSVSPNFQNRVSPTGQFFPGHSPSSHHSSSPNAQVSPNLYDSLPSHNTQQAQGYSQPASIQNVGSFHGNNVNLNEINPSNLFMQSRQTTEQTVSQSGQNYIFNNQSNMNDMSNQHVTQSNQNIAYRNQSGLQNTRDPYHSNSNSNSPPSLSVNTHQAQMTFRQMFQEPVAGPSHGATQLDDTQVDLVALLTKQLSKSNVGDACPALALTPRGTGAGYGVGVDIDALMSATDNDSQGQETSPLSSSILADWMEVTGNMNIDMEALEQELQSPMALSYNDLNMYSS